MAVLPYSAAWGVYGSIAIQCLLGGCRATDRGRLWRDSAKLAREHGAAQDDTNSAASAAAVARIASRN